MTDDHLHQALTNLATQVGGLAVQVGCVTEAVEQLERRQGDVEIVVRNLELSAAASEGATAATRELATQAGAAGARRERFRERLVNTGIAALAVIVSAVGLIVRQS